MSEKFSFRELVLDDIVGIINAAIPVLIGLAVLLFLWGGVRYIYKSGDAHGKGEERQAMFWGLVALFVVLSIAGILRVLKSIFFPAL